MHGNRLDWLILGGGIHGVHVAVRLLAEAGVPRERLRLLDPGPRLLERWRERTGAMGMSYLRSPAVHNLDLAPQALRRFAGKPRDRMPGLFAAPYERPYLGLFNAHCDHVIESHRLDELHVRDRAVACDADADRVRVELAGGGELFASDVVLALGVCKPDRPAWARGDAARVQHVFEREFRGFPKEPSTVAVVGGGVSAAQVATRLSRMGHLVHLVSRHVLREAQFDSDPGWLGPKYMTGFRRLRDMRRRRAVIDEARHRGSIPPDVRLELNRAIARGTVRLHEAEVERFEDRGSSGRLLLFDASSVEVDAVFLATGFAAERPGGEMIDGLIQSASLPVAPCGYPIVDDALRWHSRVRVTGPLAELELGAAARNIAGARNAAERIVHSLLAAQPREAAPAV